MMEEVPRMTLSNKLIEDCRDVIKPDLEDLSRAFSVEEGSDRDRRTPVGDFATVVKVPSVH
ncbi:hypothetical protein [Rhizobium leguminosarum]|uniref:hypothetical protein n=1 Tax=Rhizobium leguminosarum TaxID=384 RepID=UPI00069724BE|nr:hypothetical protein [Rhizobium leguminosarum]